jgi:DNA (cytosine-5)-methyltransferase 1
MARKTPSFNGLSPASKTSSLAKRRNTRRDTQHEVILRRELWRAGLRFRKNVETMPGKPDIVFSSPKVIVFCDGDFWHGRNWSKLKEKLKAGSNAQYWKTKIASNIKRDRVNSALLERKGWTVIRIWESDIKRDPFAAAAHVRQKVNAATHACRTQSRNGSCRPRTLRFVDLFAGLGGFHLALSRLGHRCVFASELNEGLRELYSKNFGINAVGDIRDIRPRDVPGHDVLCAGFPCQPFSKAGSQRGFDCPRWGDLFDQVLAILRYHKPEHLILENVPNLERHNCGETWQIMQRMLREEGYHIHSRRLSPHKFGIPQIRDRLFVVGSKSELTVFFWPEERSDKSLSILSALSHKPTAARKLSEKPTKCLEAWQTFLNDFPKTAELPSFPIWSMEFGATYPYENKTPYAYRLKNLHKFRGSHGVKLKGTPKNQVLDYLPSYARSKDRKFPHWKIQFIRQNREFYAAHRKMIDKWLPQILDFPPSFQKFEWNCKGAKRDLWKLVIQFRASGVRVKRPTTAPSLVAMTTTQVPIIGWEKRYMMPRECARLQSMHELKHLPQVAGPAFEALGNAVNVDLVELIARALLSVGNQKPK